MQRSLYMYSHGMLERISNKNYTRYSFSNKSEVRKALDILHFISVSLQLSRKVLTTVLGILTVFLSIEESAFVVTISTHILAYIRKSIVFLAPLGLIYQWTNSSLRMNFFANEVVLWINMSNNCARSTSYYETLTNIYVVWNIVFYFQLLH